MTNELRTVCTMPAMTEAEAKVLFVWHLQMASHIFELLPEDFKLPIGAFDDYSQDAAQKFLSEMEAVYQEAYGKEEGDDGC